MRKMGRTQSPTGRRPEYAASPEAGKRLIALAGNPNVGKSTLFNRLTGMRQHTGNWPGKTVGSAFGSVTYAGERYILADIPGAYSLSARSAEEELARDLVCFGGAQTIVVVCDASCLSRNLILALQIMELSRSVVLCINLMDEAEKKGIGVDLERLSNRLSVPVVGMSATRGEGIDELMAALERAPDCRPVPVCVQDEDELLAGLTDLIAARGYPLPARWLALRIVEGEAGMLDSLEKNLGINADDTEIFEEAERVREKLASRGKSRGSLGDERAAELARLAENICAEVVSAAETAASSRDRKIDRVLTHPVLGYPVMLGLLALVLWITVSGANVPSQWLFSLLFKLGDVISSALEAAGVPELMHGMLVEGAYKTVAWVVAVMLPPMAIFFPLFTLLEDLGFLPRVAFNLDGIFQKCSACGKQGLTMCMGFGCTAAGVVGCRIIDSPRERLIAILTNGFVPCNGKFPTMIALISVFFAGGGAASPLPSLMLTGIILAGILLTFFVSQLLSKTLLRGVPSSFTLELPPYRVPRIGQVLVRSIFDRTLFVLGRAVTVAAPAGIVIWLLANVQPGGASLLDAVCGFLDPFARIFGMDGVIFVAFILGMPANEIVLPIIIMSYLSAGSLLEMSSMDALGELLRANGWTWVTALCTMLFSLLHWPCSTALLTVKKESGSWKWAALAALIPTLCGLAICFFVSLACGA